MPHGPQHTLAQRRPQRRGQEQRRDPSSALDAGTVVQRLEASNRSLASPTAMVSPSEPTNRIGGSIAAHVVAYMNGASIIRTHDVAETIQALRVAAALRNSL